MRSNKALIGMLRSLRGKQFVLTVNAIFDILEEEGVDFTSVQQFRYLSPELVRRDRALRILTRERMEIVCATSGLVDWLYCPSHMDGLIVQTRLKEVHIDSMRVVSPSTDTAVLQIEATKVFRGILCPYIRVWRGQKRPSGGHFLEVIVPKPLNGTNLHESSHRNNEMNAKAEAILWRSFPSTMCLVGTENYIWLLHSV